MELCCFASGKSADHLAGLRFLPEDIHLYTKQVTLDLNTAHKDLTLTENRRKATRWNGQLYRDHPDRFDYWSQVLCKEAITGRCYWEVEWCGRVFIGVAYWQMCRKGDGHQSWLGHNKYSWGLSCSHEGYVAEQRGRIKPLRGAPCLQPGSSAKIGVYLDWSAGSLSFYQIDPESRARPTHLYTFHVAFTEPVHPAFHLTQANSSVELLCM